MTMPKSERVIMSDVLNDIRQFWCDCWAPSDDADWDQLIERGIELSQKYQNTAFETIVMEMVTSFVQSRERMEC